MSIGHIVYAAPAVDAAVDDLEERLGVGAQPGGKHVGLGTHNALLALGARTYLESSHPDPEQLPPSMARPLLASTASPNWGRWDEPSPATTLTRNRRRPLLRLLALPALDVERVGLTGTVLRWRLTLNAVDGGPVPFLISWGDSEHPSRRAPSALILGSFEIEHLGPQSIASVLTALQVDIDIKPASRNALVAHISGRTASTSCTDGRRHGHHADRLVLRRPASDSALDRWPQRDEDHPSNRHSQENWNGSFRCTRW